jgi:hypothetical protein
MNIILFTNKRGQVWNFELNLLHFGITGVTALVVLLAAAVYTGTRIAGNELENVAKWQGMVEEQQAEVAEARRNAQADIDALTLRIGKMQGQMLRLNALGERLVDQGDLDKEGKNLILLPLRLLVVPMTRWMCSPSPWRISCRCWIRWTARWRTGSKSCRCWNHC